MPPRPLDALKGSKLPPLSFWSDELELPLESIINDPDLSARLREWRKKLTGRQVAALCQALSVRASGSVRSKRSSLDLPIAKLVPYFLVDRFGKFKSKIAVVDFAKGVVGRVVMDLCRIGDEDNGEYDKTALLFVIYSRKRSDLPLVLHLDKVHKTGFARMELKTTARQPRKKLATVLEASAIRGLLREFDKKKRDGRKSEFRSVVTRGDHHMLFVRRAERPDYIVRSSGLIHGFRPELIILDFFAGAKRVDISSISVSVPLELANTVASAHFGKQCEYDNANEITYAAQIMKLLKALRKANTDDLSLVEIVVENSPLDGAPKIKITDPESKSIGPAIRRFEDAVGAIVSKVERIESFKVLYRKKRVSLILDAQDSPGEFVLRYSDHRLNALERRDFEDHMRATHGIEILSTEKRFKDHG